MKKDTPNLFVVGAAKAGTSSLHSYLNSHKQIHMSSIKEPHYMLHKYFENKNFEGPGDNKIISSYFSNYDDYKSLFTDCDINGETSPGYFSLEEIAIPEIKNKCNEPFIIICLRNPIKRTYSAYMHKCRDGQESLTLINILKQNIEEKRISENWAWGWYYLKDSFYYNKVKEFQANFKNVKVIFFEDLIADVDKVLNETTLFLNIDPFDKPISQVQNNKTGLPRYKLFKQIATNLYPFVSKIVNEKTKIAVKNVFVKKPEIDHEIEENLKKIFLNDIIKLSELLKVDLIEKWNINK